MLGGDSSQAEDGEEEEHDTDGDDQIGDGHEVTANIDDFKESPMIASATPGPQLHGRQEVEVDEDTAEVDHGGGGAEHDDVEAGDDGLVDTHPDGWWPGGWAGTGGGRCLYCSWTLCCLPLVWPE